MARQVKFFQVIKKITNKSEITVEGKNLEAILAELSEQFPNLEKLNRGKTLDPFIKIIRNGEEIISIDQIEAEPKYPIGDEDVRIGFITPLGDHDEICILPPLVGG